VPRKERVIVKNPFVRIREELGLKATKLAVAVGVNYSCWKRHEYGIATNIQPSVARALQRLGYNVDEVQREYDEWRKEQQESVFEAVGR
jgi:hypothetical protein